jgi:hypothetical protein
MRTKYNRRIKPVAGFRVKPGMKMKVKRFLMHYTSEE